jgi:hypothetical protein
MLMIPIRPKEAERRIFFMVIRLLGSKERVKPASSQRGYPPYAMRD